ncbi:hypothetical protein EJ08DRAFT_732796 [Tothia fuscella]|uniref:Uncharacterized protein n=1 Tax=Tothia fuscella TaxID=1048955 RepID=A0A9P4NVA1_9PEZI|nr:hypothetical protein EJ08DRAFT_732796 [Tothia fuscella]
MAENMNEAFAPRAFERNNHYDSFPEVLGLAIVKFILALTAEERERMIENIQHLTWIVLDDTPSAADIEKYTNLGYLDLKVNKQKADDWHCLLRNMQGAKCLPEILNGNLKHLINEGDFLDDNTMAFPCEWAYFIDFEEGELETWKGGEVIDVVKFDDLSPEPMTRLENYGEEEEEEKEV